MKSTFFLFLFSIIIVTTSIAQDQFKTWHKESIYLNTNFLSRTYIKEGKSYRVGFWKKNLKKELRDSKVGYQEFLKSQKNQNIALMMNVAAIATIFIAGDQGANGNEQNARYLLLGGLGLSIASIPLSIKSYNQLNRAVWMHNGELILKQ